MESSGKAGKQALQMSGCPSDGKIFEKSPQAPRTPDDNHYEGSLGQPGGCQGRIAVAPNQ